jgi:hypothetical protein
MSGAMSPRTRFVLGHPIGHGSSATRRVPLPCTCATGWGNGDEIHFTATLRKPDETKVGCSFSDAQPRRKEYECLAEVVGSASEVAFVTFIVRARAAG